MDFAGFLIAGAALFAARGPIGRQLAGAKAALNNAMHGSFPAFMRHFVSKAVLLVAVLSLVLTGTELGWALVLKSVDSLGATPMNLSGWYLAIPVITTGIFSAAALVCGIIWYYKPSGSGTAKLLGWIISVLFLLSTITALISTYLLVVELFGMGSIMAQAVLFILFQTAIAAYAYIAGKMEFETLRNADGDLIPYQNMRSVSEKWMGYVLRIFNKVTKKDPRPFLRDRLGMRFYNDPANPAPIAGWDHQPVYRNAGSTAPVAIILWIVISCGWLVGQGAWIHFFHAFDIPSVTRFGIPHFNERVAHGLAFLSAGIGVILLAVVGKILGYFLEKLISAFEQLGTLGFKLAAPVLPFLTQENIEEQTEKLFGKKGLDVLPQEAMNRGMWLGQLSLIITFAPYAFGVILFPYAKVAAGLFMYSCVAACIAGMIIIAGNYYPERRAELSKMIEDSLVSLWKKIYNYKAYLFVVAIYGSAIAAVIGRALYAETKGQSLVLWFRNLWTGITPVWVINHTWGTSLLLGFFTIVLAAAMAYPVSKIGKDWKRTRLVSWAAVGHVAVLAVYFMIAFAADAFADQREFGLERDMAATPVDITSVTVASAPSVNSGRLTLHFGTTTKVEGMMELSPETATHWGLKSRFIPVRSSEEIIPLACAGKDCQVHLVETDLPMGAWGKYRLVLRNEDGRVHQTVYKPFATDEDGDGYFLGGPMGPLDCDDTNPDIHPNAEDLTVDGVDQNCDRRDGPVVTTPPAPPVDDDDRVGGGSHGGSASPRCAGTHCTVPRLKLAEGFRQ